MSASLVIDRNGVVFQQARRSNCLRLLPPTPDPIVTRDLQISLRCEAATLLLTELLKLHIKHLPAGPAFCERNKYTRLYYVCLTLHSPAPCIVRCRSNH
jgi:hypothetical protein